MSKIMNLLRMCMEIILMRWTEIIQMRPTLTIKDMVIPTLTVYKLETCSKIIITLTMLNLQNLRNERKYNQNEPPLRKIYIK